MPSAELRIVLSELILDNRLLRAMRQADLEYSGELVPKEFKEIPTNLPIMNKKYQVFVSSTYEDLKEHRDQAVKTILRMGHLPVGMEMFNAADSTQWEIIKRHINNSDYYVVILAHRYGSTDENGVSYTEKEYNYALEQGIPCLGFIVDSTINWSPGLITKGDDTAKLEAFKTKIKSKMVSFWTSSDNLALHISAALSEVFNTKPRAGWIRANEVTANPLIAEELSRLSKRNEELLIQNNELLIQNKKLAELSAENELLTTKNVELVVELENSQSDEINRIIQYLKTSALLFPDYQNNAKNSLFDLFLKIYHDEFHTSLNIINSISNVYPSIENIKFIDSKLHELDKMELLEFRNYTEGYSVGRLTSKGKAVYRKYLVS